MHHSTVRGTYSLANGARRCRDGRRLGPACWRHGAPACRARRHARRRGEPAQPRARPRRAWHTHAAPLVPPELRRTRPQTPRRSRDDTRPTPCALSTINQWLRQRQRPAFDGRERSSNLEGQRRPLRFVVHAVAGNGDHVYELDVPVARRPDRHTGDTVLTGPDVTTGSRAPDVVRPPDITS